MRKPGRAACSARRSTSYRWLASLLASMTPRAGESLIRDAEVREYRDPSADEAHAHRVLGAAEFDGRGALQRLGVDVADPRRQHLALAERPGDAPLRAADLGGYHLVLVGVIAVGDDPEAQAVERQVAVLCLVASEVLLAQRALVLQRSDLAQLVVGLRQFQAVGTRVAGELVDEMRSVALAPGGQAGEEHCGGALRLYRPSSRHIPLLPGPLP